MNKRLRQCIRSAEERGFCLICGQYRGCTCAPIPGDLLTSIPRRVRVDLCQGQPAHSWWVCDACQTLIAVHDNRRAVRCPDCNHVNVRNPQ